VLKRSRGTSKKKKEKGKKSTSSGVEKGGLGTTEPRKEKAEREIKIKGGY